MTDEDWIDRAVRVGLDRFNERYAEAATRLKLKKLLRKCNPWRLRALGLTDCTEVVDRLVDDHISASAETKFGQTFVETICRSVPGVEPSSVEGTDFERGESLISVKSGFNWGNDGQWKSMIADFLKARTLYRNHPGVRKTPACVLGIAVGHGSKKPRKRALPFDEMRGQAFWEWLSGDAELYQKVMDAIDRLAGEYVSGREGSLRRLREEMYREFGLPGGKVDWKKLNAHVSGTVRLYKEDVN